MAMASRTLVESRAGRFTSPTKDSHLNSVLKVPGAKVTGVRIDTDNVAMWRKALKPTKAMVIPDNTPPRPSALNSIANTRANLASPAIHAPTSMQSRRKQRYTCSEESLAKSLKRCKPERAAQELQIRALEQVTAVLSARANEAQDRVTKLRGILLDNHQETDPQTYAAMQRERWMEEKRKNVVDSEAKAVKEQIVYLRFGGKSKTVQRADTQSMATADEAKRQANLAKFFELSTTRKPISSRKKSSPSSYGRTPRRVTMNDAPPMLLRTSIASTFTPYTQSHARSISLDAKLGNRSSTASSRYRNNAALEAVAENTSMDHSIVTQPAPSIQLFIPPKPEPSIAHVTAKPSATPSLPNPSSGFVTIFVPTHRSKADILASMTDVQAELPGYAVDLIGDLDYIHDHIALRPPTSAMDRNRAISAPTTRTMPPPANTPAPTSNETTTRSRHKLPKSRSLQGWSPSPSALLRKSRSSSPTKVSRPTSHLHSPLSNLFSISETLPTTAIPIPIPNSRPSKPSTSTHDSVLSFPGRNDDLANPRISASIPRTSFSSASSYEIIQTSQHIPHTDGQSSPSKLFRQRFAFIGRK